MLKSIFIGIVCILAEVSWAFALDGDSFQPLPMDMRRAIANDARPPARRVPERMLPPLSPDKVGIIRRVSLRDSERVIALTFDLCELATSTSGCDMQVLGFLREKRIPATLFMGGKWMRTHARRVRQIMREPLFEIANHAWTHGNCALLSDGGLRAQILWTQAQYELLRAEVLDEDRGVRIAPSMTLFRLPYGRSSTRALSTIASLGMRVIQWDVVGEGGRITSQKSARQHAHNIVKSVRPGSILLFHANLVPTGTALLVPEVVSLLQEKGYRFVSVSTLLTLGEAEIVMDGYFTHKGDNHALDSRFGIDGTGLRVPFRGE